MPTVYIEISIVSYLTARPSRDVITLARQELTREWWNTRRRRHDLFTSDVVVGEASEGDDEAARQRLDALRGIAELETTPEAEDLASALLEKGPLKTMRDQVIQEVEETREEIARRFDYDIKKIAAYLRERAADRREKEVAKGAGSEASPSHRSA
jgi:hypothetical protein